LHLARRCGAGIQRPRIQPDSNPIASAPGPHERKKMQYRKPSLGVDLHQALGNLTWSYWIIWLAPESFPKAIMCDERIRTLGDGNTRSAT
jgi:hypothetical protein